MLTHIKRIQEAGKAAQVYNPSLSGDRDPEDQRFEICPGKKLARPNSNKKKLDKCLYFQGSMHGLGQPWQKKKKSKTVSEKLLKEKELGT
jgi:hypothetical protein